MCVLLFVCYVCTPFCGSFFDWFVCLLLAMSYLRLVTFVSMVVCVLLVTIVYYCVCVVYVCLLCVLCYCLYVVMFIVIAYG